LLDVDGYKVLVDDGVKQSKEGKKMPGVKKLHQEPGNSSKITVHFCSSFGVISVLAGDVPKQFAYP